tara:strand:- start:4775 stop:5179 length:405 start_codon:yes stop_codon:yes gene_type:complete
MAGKLGSDNDEPIVDINIVPFVDVILVVLIIFMVTTPMIVNHSIKIQLPKAATGEDSPPSLLTFVIDKEGVLQADGKDITEEDISSIVKERLLENPEISASIAADEAAAHGKVIRIIDLIKKAGIHKFAISTTK